jgi:hypothetical protein
LEITNVTGLEKPATELINRVSEAIGGIAKPWQMKRVAKAEVEIKKLHALADLEITEVRERAIERMILEEEKNQKNIETVAQKAIPHLNQDARPQELDEDFIRYLFNKARMVSNEEMQEVWAKVLAGEANRQGSFSRRTMDLLSQMSGSDAALFTLLARSVWTFEEFTPIIRTTTVFDVTDSYSLKYSEYVHLETIGLIKFSQANSLYLTDLNQNMTVIYYSCPVELVFKHVPAELNIGCAMLTESGKELFTITGCQPSLEVFENTLNSWVENNILVSIPLHAKASYLELYSLEAPAVSPKADI